MADDRDDLEPDEHGLSRDDYAGMASQLELWMKLAWRAIRLRMVEAVTSGDHEPLSHALGPDVSAGLLARLASLPLLQLEEDAPPVQLLDVSLVDGHFHFVLRESRRSGLAALLVGDGVLEVVLEHQDDGLWKLVDFDAADEPREGAYTLEIESAGPEQVLPDDFAPPRYRVEPFDGQGMWFGVGELDGALDLAAALSRDSGRYLVYDRESLERRGSQVARFVDGVRAD